MALHNLDNKNIDELSFEEMASIHLSTRFSSIPVKNARLRSTLSFIYQNIVNSLSFEYSKQLVPYLSLCAILDQLGICYNIKDKVEPKFENGIKRCLVYFGEVDEDDELIDTLYAFRNGLLHNISLTSIAKFKGNHYKFKYNKDIENIYQKAQEKWNGNYETLNINPDKYITHINPEKFRDFVYSCIQKANDLNQKSLLQLRLSGGVMQLFYDYIIRF